MSKSMFTSNAESVKIKKELEGLMKGSKEEYRNATTPEKEALQADLGLQPKTIPASIVLKGKEVLNVSGKQRRGSSGKSAGKRNTSRSVAALSSTDVDRKDGQKEVGSNVADIERKGVVTLNVVMKGESALRPEKEKSGETQLLKEDVGAFPDFGDLFSQLLLTDEPLNNNKPAIIAATKTTKSMSLATRKPKPKKYEPPKKLVPRKKLATPTKKTGSGDNVNALNAVERMNDPQLSTINISVERNLTFDDLDEEFYEILRRKLKMDVKESKLSEDAQDDDLEKPDVKPDQRDENEEHIRSGKAKIDEKEEVVKENEASVNLLPSKEAVLNVQGEVGDDTQASFTERDDKTEQITKLPTSDTEGTKVDEGDISNGSKIQDSKEEEEQKTSYEAMETERISGKLIFAANKAITQGEAGADKDLDYEHFTDKEAAIKALSLSIEISNEDIVNIIGEKASASERPVVLPANSTAFVSKDALHYIARQRRKSFLTSWTKPKSIKSQSTGMAPPSNIHHFCTSVPAIQLPDHMKSISRHHHASDRHAFLKASNTDKGLLRSESDSAPRETKENSDEDIEPRILAMIEEREKPTEDEKRLTDLASKILEDALKQSDETKAERTFMKLQNIINQLFDESDDPVLQVGGRKMELKNDETRLYWTPAPPKFDLPPDAVKEQLIPRYQGSSDVAAEEFEMNDDINEEVEEESSSEDDAEQEDSAEFRQRIIQRAHGSASIKRKREREDEKKKMTSENDGAGEDSEEIEDQPRAPPGLQSVSEMRRMMAKLREGKANKEEREEEEERVKNSSLEFCADAPRRRTVSQPVITMSHSDFQKFESDYDVTAEELEAQSKKMIEMKEEILNQGAEIEDQIITKIESSIIAEMNIKDTEKVDDALTESNLTYDANNDSIKVTSDSISRRDTKSSLASKRLSTKLSRRPKRRLPKIASPDPERQKKIQEFLDRPAQKIKRSVSLDDFSKALRFQSNLHRSNSLSINLDFDKEIGHKFNKESGDMFFWTKDEYWYKWLDEVYPPSVQSEQEELPEVKPDSESNFDEDILKQVDVIESPLQNEIYQLLLNEIDLMTLLIDSTEATETLAIHLCRRGACHRKIGDLKRAKDDLERSIELEPKLIDAYWHRHLLHLLQGNSKKALADLDYILNHNTRHVGAYRSRAELYKKKGDLTAAIFNYSQAIRLRPKNPDVYYERAYMFEQRGDILLALEDFKEATILQPSRTEGIRNIGLYHFENRSWTAAVNDFTALLAQEPYNEDAYTYRGRAFAKLTQYQNALQDISTAIHLNPSNSVAFYFRGCLLRKSSQRQSLQDFSTSILLDDSAANVNAYLHRGILYTEMKRWEEAMFDFETSLRLNPQMPAAHVNLGLIHMTKMNNPHMAVRRFNIAIRVDPTYVRAYICRAEANQMLHSIKEAILDYTRAIHLQPDVTEYRMTRGKLLMEYGKFDLASYHIKQCAAMGKGKATSTTQQAAVLSFLKNHKQAIEIIERSVKIKHLPQLYILLGKTKMKAKMLSEAIESFGNALKIMKPWDEKSEWPLSAAEVYYLIGMAHTDLVNHSSALEAFNNALKINPEYSKAYYQRGLTKMKLRHAKAVQDFNRALAYNPKFFQAYLSRAEYYGMKGRFAKAILNCNEAIRLKPSSIRGYLYRGALKYNIRAYQLAVKDLSEAIAIDANCNLAYFNRAVCYQEMKHYQRALKDYGIVLLLEKKENMKVLQNRGLLYLETGELENALKDFSAASKLEPRNPKLYHTLGICYHKLRMIDKAVECFSNALKTDVFFVDALLGRGNAVMDYGTPESNTIARRDYLRALHLDPRCLPARVNLAYSLQVQGRFKAAWIQFSKCIDIDENFKSAYEGRAIINLQMGNTFGAFLDINQALKIEETAEFLTNRGVINQFIGDTVNAMRDYQAALKKDPSYSLAYYNAANVYFSHRQFQQALEYYDRAIGWDKTDESAHLNRGITRVMLRNFDGALEDFNTAAELSPFAAHIYFNRGNLNASSGRFKNAEEDYTKALTLQPGDALVFKRRADVRSKLSLKEQALSDYKQAIFIQTQRIKAS